MSDPTHQPAPAHLFLAGALRRDRRECLGTLLLPGPAHPAVRVIDANRRSGGPYTVAGALMRALVPAALIERPDLVATHQVEILTAADDLRGIVPATQETLTSLAVPSERTRFYARQRTLRIAHGLKEFLHDLLSAPGQGPCAVVVDGLDHADPTDAEFIAVLLRRMDPAVLTVVAGGTTGLLDPAAEAPAEPGTPWASGCPPLSCGTAAEWTAPPPRRRPDRPGSRARSRRGTWPATAGTTTRRCSRRTVTWHRTSGSACTTHAPTNWRRPKTPLRRSAPCRSTASTARIRSVRAWRRWSRR